MNNRFADQSCQLQTDAERREGMRKDLLAMAERALDAFNAGMFDPIYHPRCWRLMNDCERFAAEIAERRN